MCPTKLRQASELSTKQNRARYLFRIRPHPPAHHLPCPRNLFWTTCHSREISQCESNKIHPQRDRRILFSPAQPQTLPSPEYARSRAPILAFQYSEQQHLPKMPFRTFLCIAER